MGEAVLDVLMLEERVILTLLDTHCNIRIFQGDMVAIYGAYNELVMPAGIGVVRELSPGLHRIKVMRILRKEAKNLGFLEAPDKARQVRVALGLPNIRASNLSGVQKALLSVGCTMAQGHTVMVTENFAAGLSPEAYIQVTKIIKELIQQKKIIAFISISREQYFFDHFEKSYPHIRIGG